LEADDIIGTLSTRFSNQGIKVTIVTSDKDLLQLVNSNVKVLISKVGVSDMLEYNINNFKELNDGLNPSQIIDLKGIMGDNSDNLKGVKGVGPKTAINLLNEYKTLENIILNIDNLPKSLFDKFNIQSDDAFLCKKIATIIIDGDVKISLDEMKQGDINKKDLVKFLEYNSIYNVANIINKK
jgi:DNA polymerase-1